MSGAAQEVIRFCRRSVDGQDLPTTGAAARAAEVARIAGGRLHHDVEASRSRDHGGCNGNLELGTVSHGGGKGGAIENHNGGGNEMAAGRNDDEAGRQLRKDHGCWRDRVEDRYGAGTPAEGIQRVAPRQEQKQRDQPRTEAKAPIGRGHERRGHEL